MSHFTGSRSLRSPIVRACAALATAGVPSACVPRTGPGTDAAGLVWFQKQLAAAARGARAPGARGHSNIRQQQPL